VINGYEAATIPATARVRTKPQTDSKFVTPEALFSAAGSCALSEQELWLEDRTLQRLKRQVEARLGQTIDCP